MFELAYNLMWDQETFAGTAFLAIVIVFFYYMGRELLKTK